MQDYRLNGVPVSQISDQDLKELLEDGFDFNELDGYDETTANTMVRERLELEVFIRQHNLRSHV